MCSDLWRDLWSAQWSAQWKRNAQLSTKWSAKWFFFCEMLSAIFSVTWFMKLSVKCSVKWFVLTDLCESICEVICKVTWEVICKVVCADNYISKRLKSGREKSQWNMTVHWNLSNPMLKDKRIIDKDNRILIYLHLNTFFITFLQQFSFHTYLQLLPSFFPCCLE